VEWVKLAQDRDQWLSFVNTVTDLWVGKCLIAWPMLAFQDGLCWVCRRGRCDVDVSRSVLAANGLLSAVVLKRTSLVSYFHSLTGSGAVVPMTMYTHDDPQEVWYVLCPSVWQ
jgi:hypothetical protein